MSLHCSDHLTGLSCTRRQRPGETTKVLCSFLQGILSCSERKACMVSWEPGILSLCFPLTPSFAHFAPARLASLLSLVNTQARGYVRASAVSPPESPFPRYLHHLAAHLCHIFAQMLPASGTATQLRSQSTVSCLREHDLLFVRSTHPLCNILYILLSYFVHSFF